MLLTRLFLRLILRLLPLIVVLCVFVPALGGRSLPADDAWQQFGFSVCDLPCFSGITPGRTPFNEMPTLLRRSIPLIGNRLFNAGTAINFWASLPAAFSGGELSGWARNNSGLVAEIRLTARLSFDHLLLELGTPDCVLTSQQQSTIVIWIRKAISIGAVLNANEQNFGLNSRVSTLWTRSAEPDDCWASGARAWHGFARVADYAQ